MTDPVIPAFCETDLDAIAETAGRIALVVSGDGRMNQAARRINRLGRGALARLLESEAFARLEPGGTLDMAFPSGLAASALQVVRLERRAGPLEARKAGAAIAARAAGEQVLVLAGNLKHAGELGLGLALRAYDFARYKSRPGRTGDPADRDGAAGRDASGGRGGRPEAVRVMVTGGAAAARADLAALGEGVFFTRDLVNEPANVLTTVEFANRLKALEKLGVKVTVLEEKELEALGMRALLAVGQGSQSPSKVVVMEWQGAGKGDRPLALVGKGVVFDTGGISIKPAAGMQDMTMDMGGAGVVAGVMKALALRKARANVVGVVGLVENMPDGRAQRPGDVVASMKGDTIEVINTDAEGRLVLADILWYAQEKFAPAAMVDLATLTGAIIVGLGHENAGVFSNDDTLANAFLKAAAAEGEGAWRMPLGPAYDAMLKSRIADMRNATGRPAGSITAAQFLKRFVKDETPWIHLDIAGVALADKATALAPRGATGWGVLALNRLIADSFEG